MSRQRAPRRADLSQHFLRSRSLAASLIAQAPVAQNDLVVEVGAGRGILTRELARRCREVVAVEFDGALAEALRARFRTDSRITIVRSDFLRFRLPDVPYKVLGNIPFNRTAAIVRRLVRSDPPPRDAWLVVQREAAERFVGRPCARETLSSLLPQTVVADRDRAALAPYRLRSPSERRRRRALARAPPETARGSLPGRGLPALHPQLLRPRRRLDPAVPAIRIHANPDPPPGPGSPVRSFRTTRRPHLRPVARTVPFPESHPIVGVDAGRGEAPLLRTRWGGYGGTAIMTGMKTTSDIPGKHEAWLRSWLDAADEAVRQAPAGRSAREELAADRNRLEPVIHRSAR